MPNGITSLRALALGAATALACAGKPDASEPFSMVTVEEVERMMGEPDVAIVDANSRGTFEKSHLPGATHYRSAPFAEVLPKDRAARVIFYCASPT